MNIRHNFISICAGFLLLLFLVAGCNFTKSRATFNDASSVSPGPGPSPGPGGLDPAPGPTPLSGNGVAKVPTAKAVIARITNGLEGHVGYYSSNFAAAIKQVGANLSNTTDPTAFSGADANMLLAYAGCSDVAPKMSAYYSITASASVATSKTALVNAGVRILDRYTGGLASSGSTKAQVTSAFSNIVETSIANGATTQMAFITVCTAANSAGSTMLGL